MIRLILEIEEKEQKLIITKCKVNTREIGRRYTEAEKKCSNIIKERINLGGGTEAINLSSEKNTDKIINDLLKNIL